MDFVKLNFKKILGFTYIIFFLIGLVFVFTLFDVSDFTNYNFIRENRNSIIYYKENNFFFLTIIFFIIAVFWTLFLIPGLPTALFSGFVFGKWWGTLILVFANTLGAVTLYFIIKIFFSKMVEKKLASKFSKIIEIIKKNELFYFLCFRLIGGAGTPFPIQNILPVVFNMSIKNYFIATLIGIVPVSFISVALGSGIEKFIEQNTELSFKNIIFSPEIYFPILGFFILLLLSILVKKKIFNK
jgi:uncharacterized membrane protein YdjX (TVP38/TMEM64 family)